VNGDKRHDIITPAGWLEAAADVRAAGEWTFHATDWASAPSNPAPSERPAEFGFMYALNVNKDGRNDILTTMAHSYGVLWFEQQPDGGWVRRMVDATWANAHASALADLNGDGQFDLITAKRYFGRGGSEASEREPMGIYWYQFRPGPKGSIGGSVTSSSTEVAPAPACRWPSKTWMGTAIAMSSRRGRQGYSCRRTSRRRRPPPRRRGGGREDTGAGGAREIAFSLLRSREPGVVWLARGASAVPLPK
jgi:hypothetical protein